MKKTWLVLGGVAVLFALNKFSKQFIAQQVADAILEKIGPDAPPSLVEAAESAGKCFAATATIPDLVKYGLARA